MVNYHVVAGVDAAREPRGGTRQLPLGRLAQLSPAAYSFFRQVRSGRQTTRENLGGR